MERTGPYASTTRRRFDGVGRFGNKAPADSGHGMLVTFAEGTAELAMWVAWANALDWPWWDKQYKLIDAPKSGARSNWRRDADTLTVTRPLTSTQISRTVEYRIMGTSSFARPRQPRGGLYSSRIPALRRPAKYVVSTKARIVGTPQASTTRKRAMLEYRSSPTSLRASASSAAAGSISPLRA
jgi:hypothetical protein